jgi:adenine-specific DNA-methyltransferase
MILNIIPPKRALNKAFLKEKVGRQQIENFKTQLHSLLGRIDETESEEHLKNIISDFLKDAWYKDLNEINTKGKSDLAIHTGRTSKDPVGVLLEIKRTNNRSEMISGERLNVKALHELVLYYLRERVDFRNINLKHLIITNGLDWYIIDENWFEDNIYRNTKLRKDFDNWKLSGKDTRAFYDDIAKTHIDEINVAIDCTYFNLRDYVTVTEGLSPADDKKLIAIYKILSPVHLLKQPFANDSNSLDKKFYTELLHIIGLEERKVLGRKLIQRKEKRSHASLIENCIIQIEERLNNIENLSEYGVNKDQQLFAIALELTITWVNRILFLKLLEAQLFRYHNDDPAYGFLNIYTLKDFGDVKTLFFNVLAERRETRHEHLRLRYDKIPYLNSSLFERTKLENTLIDIGGLVNDAYLNVLPSTVLKDERGQRRTGQLNCLQYLFEFLDAFDFSSEGSEDIQEQNKNLINASVLGLIFEKINGYKDGSFFTPGIVTMQICRETIRASIIQKFNNAYALECDTFNDLKNFIGSKYRTTDILQFNQLINEIKICDPAVGSGHFLVSALNELLAIKSELGIIADATGVRLTGYEIKVENDELIVTYNDNTEIFQYKVYNGSVSSETQRVQRTLFHEKENIIERCLFGVDLNPNSVKICRLRLWIELLKNTYYKEEAGFTNLETLPNIDINIKQGNSLISRYSVGNSSNTKLASKYSLDQYRGAFHDYHKAENKTRRREIEQLLDNIKSDYRSVIYNGDPLFARLSSLRGRREKLENQVAIGDLFAKSKKSEVQIDLDKLQQSIAKIETTIDNIRKNKVFNQAFEWRLEFPDVINNDGSFRGFDVIIGNPPYVFGGNEGIPLIEKQFFKENYETGNGKINLFTLFIERGLNILASGGHFGYIIPNTFLRVTSYHESRKYLLENFQVDTIVDLGDSVFEDAITTAIVLLAQKNTPSADHIIQIQDHSGNTNSLNQQQLSISNFVIATNVNDEKRIIFNKIERNAEPLGSICKELIFGIVITLNKDEVVSETPHSGWKPFLEGRDIGPYLIKPVHNYLNYQPALLHRPRSERIFEAPEKILLQRITGGARPLKAAYDDQQFYNKESINNLILQDEVGYDYKFILGLLNSKLINWYYTNQFTNESKLTVNLSKEYLSRIPVYPATQMQQSIVVKLVDYLLVINQPGLPQIDAYVPNSFLFNLFSEIIDAIIFELYFNDDFRNAEIGIIRLANNEIPAVNVKEADTAIKIISKTYQQLREKDSELRNAMKLMDIRLPELVMPIKSIK